MPLTDENPSDYTPFPASPEHLLKSVNDIHRRLSHIEKNGNGDGGGGDDGDMKVKVAVLEQIAKDTRETLKEIKSDLRNIKSSSERDFRILFGAIITASLGLGALMLGLLGLMAKGFHWL